MKKIILSLALSVFFSLGLFSQTGSITNIQVEQRSDGSGLVDVHFDLDGPANEYFITLRVSFDAGGIYWAVNKITLSGDTGPLTPGSSKHIVWSPTQQYPDRYSPETKLKIIAYIQENMNPCPGAETITDIDGNTYNTVQIGEQCWMKENLNTTHDANGNLINRYCYNDSTHWCELYGGLYKWNAVMNGATSSNSNPSGVQGICPNGWHVPSEAEWTELTDFLINTNIDINFNNVGDKLKSCRQVSSPIFLEAECNTTEHPRWVEHSVHHGTNDFGFTALPGGSIYTNNYNSIGTIGYWWSSRESSSSYSRLVRAQSISGLMHSSDLYKSYGISIRCVKD